jgi:pimeloyl-ACP methyl ester carboxylesterase
VIAAFREDFTEDLKKISVPVLALHGEDDQVVNPATTEPRAAELFANGTLKTYPGCPLRRRTSSTPTAGLHPVLPPGTCASG